MFTKDPDTAEVARLKGRVGELNDNLQLLKIEVDRFKRQVTEDMAKIVEQINKR